MGPLQVWPMVYRTVLYRTVLYYTVLYCTVMYGANTSGIILVMIILDSSKRIFYKLITEETEETVG